MTDVARDEDTGAPGDVPHGTYELARRLTASGRGAVEKAVHDFVDDLMATMDRHTHNAAELTARDVEASLGALGRERHRPTSPTTNARTAERRTTLAPLLVTVGTVGIPVSVSFLHSPVQIVVFALLVVAGLIGLILTWAHSTHRREP